MVQRFETSLTVYGCYHASKRATTPSSTIVPIVALVDQNRTHLFYPTVEAHVYGHVPFCDGQGIPLLLLVRLAACAGDWQLCTTLHG